MDKPQCIEVKIHRGGDGKVAIVDFGRLGSGYGLNITRTYAIPEGWTDEQVSEFEAEKLDDLKEFIEPYLDAEFNERWNQREWSGDDPTQD